MNHKGGAIYVKASEFVWSSLITGCGIRTFLRSQGVLEFKAHIMAD